MRHSPICVSENEQVTGKRGDYTRILEKRIGKCFASALHSHALPKRYVTSINFARVTCAHVFLFVLSPRSLTDFHYSEKLLDEARAFDEKLKRFAYQLEEHINSIADGKLLDDASSAHRDDNDVNDTRSQLCDVIRNTEAHVCAGIADDLDLNRGLVAVMELCNLFTANVRAFNLVEAVRTKLLFERWLSATGLDFYRLRRTLCLANANRDRDDALLSELSDIRNKLRALGVAHRKKRRQSGVHDEDGVGDTLLQLSDELRAKLRERGIIVDDCSVNKA